MYRISQIKLALNEPKELLPKKIKKKLGNNIEIKEYKIVKESIDARDKGDIKFVYTVDFDVEQRQGVRKIALKPDPKKNLSIAPDMSYKAPEPGVRELKHRPVIAGFGPCGIFCALILAQQGYRPIVLERGKCVSERAEDVQNFWNGGVLNTESNVQFGEGGAGTFSDGKLTTGIKDPRIHKVLSEFVSAGAPEEILYKNKPHIGTDLLRDVVANIREEIIRLSGEIRFSSKLVGIDAQSGKIRAVKVQEVLNGESYTLETENLVLAIGHSARDTFRYAHELGIQMSAKPFSIGVRIEHPQKMVDEAQYGKTKGLPPAEYKLSHRCENGRGVYTFCMCPGGEVIMSSSQDGGVVTNGMSNHKRDSGTANSGLLVDVRVSDFDGDDALAGVEFQEKYERLAYKNGGGRYAFPKTCWSKFRDGDKDAKAVIDSIPSFAVESIREAMPYLGRKLKGFDDDNAVMKAVETRSSSPVRFFRDDNLQGSIKGLYPAGEGAGYAGGITSAACDGIKVAEKIIEEFCFKA
ncbi:MAG: NAD(FAD)-utilizing dehydrogenase [[Eubacterium] sulci]|nr:NAD(FAD)-utilizing dehydrogenase [[Eubacterium] sulci]